MMLMDRFAAEVIPKESTARGRMRKLVRSMSCLSTIFSSALTASIGDARTGCNSRNFPGSRRS